MTTVNISFTRNDEHCELIRNLQEDELCKSMINYIILHSINSDASVHNGSYERELKECGVDYSSIKYEKINLL